MDLILASTSPYRRALLARLGVPFRCVAPEIDEDQWKGRGLGPRELAEGLAAAKAVAVARREPGAIVIGSDQLVAFQGRVLGKPGTADRAVEQLMELSGCEHLLITAMSVQASDRVDGHTDVARLRLRELSRDEAERYVEAERPIDCAGSYKIEGLGIALFDRVESEDHTAIVGLPLIALATILRGFGLPIP